MITPGSPYGRKTANRQKDPLYYVKFDAVSDGAFVPALSTEYSTGRITNQTKERPALMLMPSGSSQSISVLGGTSTIGDLQFSLIDKEETITKLVMTYPMKNRKVEIWGGYAGLPESQFLNLFVGLINNVEISSDGTAWIWTVTDFQRLSKTKTAFSANTILAQDMTDTDMIALVASTENFAAQTISGTRGEVNFIRIDDEIMSYNAKTAPSLTVSTGSFTIYGRGLFGTIAKNHNKSATVTNFILVDGNPLDILLWLYTSTGTGTNGPYDILEAGQGASIPQDFIDITKIEQQRDRFLSGFRMQFFLQSPTEIKAFVEQEILLIVNGYPLVNNDGRLSVKLFTVPLLTEVVSDFNDSNMAGKPTFQLNMESQKAFFNEVDFKYNYDAIADEFLQEDLFLREDSILESDEEAVLTVQSQGLRPGDIFNGSFFSKRYANQVFKRFSKGCPMISVEMFYSTHLVELGDFVTVTSLWLPNIITRQRGGSAFICEIVDKQIDYQQGRVRYKLQATGFLTTKKYFIIAPNAYPDYLSATEAQRKYGFISKKLGAQVGVMSNGDGAYYISP